MTAPRTAYHRGIWDTILTAEEAAAAIEARPDAHAMRQRAASEALRGFAAGAREALIPQQADPSREGAPPDPAGDRQRPASPRFRFAG